MTGTAYLFLVIGAIAIFGLAQQLERTRRQRDDALVANMRLVERLGVAEVVTDTLAYDLAEAIRPITDWEPPVSPVTDTPLHEATVLDFVARDLNGGAS